MEPVVQILMSAQKELTTAPPTLTATTTMADSPARVSVDSKTKKTF